MTSSLSLLRSFVLFRVNRPSSALTKTRSRPSIPLHSPLPPFNFCCILFGCLRCLSPFLPLPAIGQPNAAMVPNGTESRANELGVALQAL